MFNKEYWTYDEIIDSLTMSELKDIVSDLTHIESVADALMELADTHKFYDAVVDEDFEYDSYKDDNLD